MSWGVLSKVLPIAAGLAALYFSGGTVGAEEFLGAGELGSDAAGAVAAGSGAAAGDAAISSAYGASQLPSVTTTSSALSGGSSYLPYAIGGSAVLGYEGQAQTNAANAAMAQQQMAFQASQTGTAYQRAVADMQAAGLNPMLAYQQGGASSGSGSTAVMGNSLGAATSSALNAAMTTQQVENLSSQNALTQLQMDNTQADTAGKVAAKLNTMQDTKLKASTQANNDAALAGIAADSARKAGTVAPDISSAESLARGRAAEAKMSELDVSSAALKNAGTDSSVRRFIAPVTGILNDIFNSAHGARRAFE